MKVVIPSYPKVSDYIELPAVDELLKVPMFHRASLDDAYRVGGEVIRYLIDKTPLIGTYRYQSLQVHCQLLNVGYTTFPTYRERFSVLDWHVDTDDIYTNQSVIHLLENDVTCTTVFNETPNEIEFEGSTLDYWQYLNDHEEELGLKGRKMEPNKFATFSTHPHHGSLPQQQEIRFFFRVSESNVVAPAHLSQTRRRASYIYDSNSQMHVSVEQVLFEDTVEEVTLNYY